MGNYWLNKGLTLEEARAWYEGKREELELARRDGQITSWNTELYKDDDGKYIMHIKLVVTQPADYIIVDLSLGDNNG